jgi:hypothetical protein
MSYQYPLEFNVEDPPKSVEDILKKIAKESRMNTGFDDIKRCRLSDEEKDRTKDEISQLSDRTYTGQSMEKTASVPSGIARVTVKAAKSLIDSRDIIPDKLQNAICDVAARKAKMPILESPAGEVFIQDGHHRIMAADELGYKEIEVSYPLADEENLKRQLGDEFRPCRTG